MQPLGGDGHLLSLRNAPCSGTESTKTVAQTFQAKTEGSIWDYTYIDLGKNRLNIRFPIWAHTPSPEHPSD